MPNICAPSWLECPTASESEYTRLQLQATSPMSLTIFIKAARSGRPYLQDWREAFDAAPMVDALARSSETGLPVDVER
jgi:hypothetical protein